MDHVRQAFRRIPLLARIAWVVGMLCLLGALGLAWWMLATLQPDSPQPPDSQRLVAIMLSLIALGVSNLAIGALIANFSFARSQGVHRFVPHTWQSQACIFTLLMVLPICALALAPFVPLSPLGYLSIDALALVSMFASAAIYGWGVLVAFTIVRQLSARSE